jgi:hypothetical protein
MATAAILNFFNPSKAATHYGGYSFFQHGCRCHGNGQNAKKNEKHKNYHSRLLAKQKLMKLDRNDIQKKPVFNP